MRITFILPHTGHNPIGGFKVAYEYANGLAQRGHEVTAVHAPICYYGDSRPLLSVRNSLVFCGRMIGLRGGFRPHNWFQIDPRVKMLWVPSLDRRWIPSADAVIATAWNTSEWVAGYPAAKGSKYYLIQHQESLFPNTDTHRAMATWKLPLRKIVIARWLEEIASGLGEESVYIPNGLDFDAFGLDIPLPERDPCRLIMLYHDQDWKGSRDGLAAMSIAKKEIPGLKATLFGVPTKPEGLPDWIEYVRKPAQLELRLLYNAAAIFVSPSWAEGWPLPPAEAAQCGAALCITDIGGHREYAVAGETALLSPPKDSNSLAKNIQELIRNSELRYGLASRANALIRQFTWHRAVTEFERTLFSRTDSSMHRSGLEGFDLFAKQDHV